jgi:hypothetical protein
MRRYLPLLIVAALGLTACEKTIRAHGAEDTIVLFVKQKTGQRAENAKCPSGIEAKKGKTFDCTFDGPDGKYVAHMRVDGVQGSKVNFFIQTERK